MKSGSTKKTEPLSKSKPPRVMSPKTTHETKIPSEPAPRKDPIYPDIIIPYTKGMNGLILMEQVIIAMRKKHISINAINDYRKKALPKNADYKHLIEETKRWVHLA